MVSKKWLFVIIFFLMLGGFKNYLICDDLDTNIYEQRAVTDSEMQSNSADDEEDDDVASIEGLTIEKSDLTDNQKENFSFTKDDVVDFSYRDMQNMIYYHKLYQAPIYHNIKINNIWLTNLQIPSFLYMNKLSNLGNVYENRFSKTFYPYAVTLTRLYAGLGDYDQNFAHVSMFKNEFMSKPNLHFRGDFRGSDEYKDGINQKSSDFYIQFDYAAHIKSMEEDEIKEINDAQKIDFGATFMTSSKNLLARYYLFEDSFKNVSEVINDSWRFVSFEVLWKNLFINYFFSENVLSSERTAESLNFDSSGLLLGALITNEYNELKLTYQLNMNEIGEPYLYKKKDNMVSLEHNMDTEKLDINTGFIVFDNFSKIDITQKVFFKLYNDFNLVTNMKYSDINRPQIQYKVENYANHAVMGGISINMFSHIENRMQTLLSAQEDFVSNKLQSSLFYWSIQSNYLVGQKKITQYTNVNTLDEDFISFSSEIKVAIFMRDFLLKLINNFEYDNFHKEFILTPKYYNTLDVSLSWLMKQNNRVCLGSRLNIISEIFNETSFPIKDNPLLDVYFLLGITKLFDIKVELKNIYRNAYFGSNVINDFHITSHIVWYFIN